MKKIFAALMISTIALATPKKSEAAILISCGASTGWIALIGLVTLSSYYDMHSARNWYTHGRAADQFLGGLILLDNTNAQAKISEKLMAETNLDFADAEIVAKKIEDKINSNAVQNQNVRIAYTRDEIKDLLVDTNNADSEETIESLNKLIGDAE